MKLFVITIEGNEISEAYYRTCETTCKFNNYDTIKFSAITPNTIKVRDEIIFDKMSSQTGTREFTDTEKSVFYSHFDLWNVCYDFNTPLIILEHDTLLVDELPKMCYSTILGFRFKNNTKVPASGAGYYLKPSDALKLIQSVEKPVNVQLDGHIHKILPDMNFAPCFFNYVHNEQTTINHKE